MKVSICLESIDRAHSLIQYSKVNHKKKIYVKVKFIFWGGKNFCTFKIKSRDKINDQRNQKKPPSSADREKPFFVGSSSFLYFRSKIFRTRSVSKNGLVTILLTECDLISLFLLGSIMKTFILIILLFSSQSRASNLELECFGTSDLPNLYYGKEILTETWRLGLEPKSFGFYFTLNESEKTGKVRFAGFMNKETISKNKSFSLSNLKITEEFISAKVKIDIDRKGTFEIDRGTGLVRYWSKSWPKSVTGTCEKLKVLKPKFWNL